MPHTRLTKALWFGLMEAEDRYQFKLASMVAMAALGSHPSMDVAHSQTIVGKKYDEALFGMPYMDRQQTVAVSEDVQKAVDAYHRWSEYFARNNITDIGI